MNSRASFRLYPPVSSTGFIQQIMFFCICLILPSQAKSQCEPVVVPSSFCEEAPLLCLNQFCFQSSDFPFVCCNGFCGAQTAIHNPQYFAFTADAETVEISINVGECNLGQPALQSAIIDACPFDNSNIIACDPGTPQGGTMHLVAEGLIPGFTYWLLIDGSAGAICEYIITSTQGILLPEIVGQLSIEESFISDTLICQGMNDLYIETGGNLYFHTGYQFTTSWNQDTFLTQDPFISIDVDYDAPVGDWEVCVRGYSGCDTSNVICFAVEIYAIPPVTKDTAIFCPEYFPFIWHNQIITGPGTYEQTFFPQGCPFDSIWTIESFPVSQGFIDTTVCATSLIYDGQLFSASGIYTLFHAGENQYGCDSVTLIQVTLNGFDFFVESTCDSSEVILSAHISSSSYPIDTLIYQWMTCDMDSVISDESAFSPDSSGCYCLVIATDVCVDTLCSYYSVDACPLQCDLVAPAHCLDNEILFAYPDTIPAAASGYWTISQSGEPPVYIQDSLSFSFLPTQTGAYLVSFTIQGDTTVTCLDSFEVFASPVVLFCCDTIICDSCLELTLWSDGGASDIILNTPAGDTTLAQVEIEIITVCPPLNTIVTYSIASAAASASGCVSAIQGPGQVVVGASVPPAAEIYQSNDTLFANQLPQAAYLWRPCGSQQVLSFSHIFVPDSSGCYCVELIDGAGWCADTACYEFIIDGVTNPDHSTLTILSPNPSIGQWNVSFSDVVSFPVQWQLISISGQYVDEGVIAQNDQQFKCGTTPSKGFYILAFYHQDHVISRHKVVIQ